MQSPTSGQTNFAKSPAVRIAALIALAVVMLVFLFPNFIDTRRVVALAGTSDGTHTAFWRKHDDWLDNNYSLVIRDHVHDKSQVVFKSPDEGPPKGVRLLWSTDNTTLLIVGPNFYVKDNATLPNGDKLYLLYDVTTGTIRCNATQQNTYNSFTVEDVNSHQWPNDQMQHSPSQ